MTPSTDRLLSQFKALADPIKVRLVTLCAIGECSVSELTQVTGQSQPRISQHLKQLCAADLLERFRDGHFVYYRVPDCFFYRVIDWNTVNLGSAFSRRYTGNNLCTIVLHVLGAKRTFPPCHTLNNYRCIFIYYNRHIIPCYSVPCFALYSANPCIGASIVIAEFPLNQQAYSQARHSVPFLASSSADPSTAGLPSLSTRIPLL